MGGLFGALPINGQYNDHKGVRNIGIKEFPKRTHKGCAWCGSAATWGQRVAFIDHDEFICDDCMDTDEVKEYMDYVA